MNTPVSPELAKLLKEKGFDINEKYNNYYIANMFYNSNGVLTECEEQSGSLSLFEGIYSAPTISDVVMWLYKEHGIWISVDPDNDTDTWFYTISHNKSETVFGNYNGPTEVYEKAIEHVLNNMI